MRQRIPSNTNRDMQSPNDNSVRFPHLLKTKLLQNLPDSLKRKYLNSCEVKSHSPEINFIEQGEVATGIFLVAHGCVEISRLNPAGQNVFMSLAEVGDCVGEIEAVAVKQSIASCSGKKGTILLFLPRKLLVEYLGNIEFVKNLSLIFLERMDNNNSFRSIDKLDPVSMRLRSYLNFMSVRNATIDKSQAELAAIICCSRQTMNKELGVLRKKGIIDLQSGAVVILDRENLAEGVDQP